MAHHGDAPAQGVVRTSPHLSLGHAQLCWDCPWIADTVSEGAQPLQVPQVRGGDATSPAGCR